MKLPEVPENPEATEEAWRGRGGRSEAVIVAHDRVQQAAVIAVPDDLREEEVMAYVKAPGYVLFVDSLPDTSSQKVHKLPRSRKKRPT
jgi:non-ribosomal peptide synthetase component E (peptide arylation enzyme)